MKNAFNLLKPQAEPPTIWSKIYEWMVGTARIIVIFVELIVIGAFVIRIVIDVQAKELDKTIKTTEETLDVLQASENRFRAIQNKTRLVEDSYNGSLTYVEIVEEVNKYLPVNAKEINVQISGKDIIVSGFAAENTLSESESGYKNSTYFDRVELTKFETGEDPTTSGNFSFTMIIKVPKYRVFDSTRSPLVTPPPL